MCIKNDQPCVLSRARRALLYATIMCVAIFGVSAFNTAHSAGYPSDLDWRGVAFGNGVFVAVASSGTDNRVMTSVDG